MSKLEELRARKAERDATAQKQAEDREVAALELEEQLLAKGMRAEDLRVVVTDVGVFAVRTPEFVVGKRFADTPTEKRTTEDVVQFAAACVVHPEQAEARAAFQAYGGVAWRLAGVAMSLWEADAGARRGK